MRNADSVVVGQLFDQFMATSIPEQKKDYSAAIGNVHDKNILKKYLELSLDSSVSLTKGERTDLCISVATGSQYGMKQVVHLLLNHFDEATERLHINEAVKGMSYAIKTPEAYDEFLPLLKRAAGRGLRTDDSLQKIQSDLEERVDDLQKEQKLITKSTLKYISADGTVSAAANDAH